MHIHFCIYIPVHAYGWKYILWWGLTSQWSLDATVSSSYKTDHVNGEEEFNSRHEHRLEFVPIVFHLILDAQQQSIHLMRENQQMKNIPSSALCVRVLGSYAYQGRCGNKWFGRPSVHGLVCMNLLPSLIAQSKPTLEGTYMHTDITWHYCYHMLVMWFHHMTTFKYLLSHSSTVVTLFPNRDSSASNTSASSAIREADGEKRYKLDSCVRGGCGGGRTEWKKKTHTEMHHVQCSY